MKRLVVVSALGLAVLVAGGATAASLIDSGDIKNRSIKKKDLSRKAVKQLKGNRGPQGPQGPQGSTGITGIGTVESSVGYCANSTGICSVESATATCPGGSRATGGSATASTIDAHISTDVGSDDYFAIVDNASEFDGILRVEAVCVAGPGIPASAATASSSSRSERAARVAELRAQK
jgi:hypothetical protein